MTGPCLAAGVGPPASCLALRLTAGALHHWATGLLAKTATLDSKMDNLCRRCGKATRPAGGLPELHKRWHNMEFLPPSARLTSEHHHDPTVTQSLPLVEMPRWTPCAAVDGRDAARFCRLVCCLLQPAARSKHLRPPAYATSSCVKPLSCFSLQQAILAAPLRRIAEMLSSWMGWCITHLDDLLAEAAFLFKR